MQRFTYLTLTLLKQEFDAFAISCSKLSEMSQYWDRYQQNVNFLLDLVAADREGDWEGHLLDVQNLLPIFRECDGINYLRYASLYLEMMWKLPLEHPDIYRQFVTGCFVAI